MKQKQDRLEIALYKELQAVEKQEKKLEQAAQKAKASVWKAELENRIPEKVAVGLESAFCKGFCLVFEQGKAVIEKSYHKENLQNDHAVLDFAVQRKGSRKELKKVHKSAKQANLVNMAVTTVEGIGLGALGIGMPDVVLFLGMLLKGVYETALNYGFDYDSKQEQLLILKMMETALSRGEDWQRRNAEADALFDAMSFAIAEEDFRAQMKATASVFAADMILLKFVQTSFIHQYMVTQIFH